MSSSADVVDGAPDETKPNSFGVKKVIDCKIGEGGMQMYKVKWEATWEPAEHLASCQHLIDEFWSFMNNARNNQKMLQKIDKIKLKTPPRPAGIEEDCHKINEDDKAEIHSLIARTSSKPVGNQILRSPSELLASPTDPLSYVNTTNSCNIQPQYEENSFLNQNNVQTGQNFHSAAIKETLTKSESDVSKKLAPKTSDFSKDNLKYLENFSNPYVKIILVCIKCNKELSMKFQSTWKRHYLTHVDDNEKPFKCSVCGKAFVQSTQLTSHMKRHAKDDKDRVARAMSVKPPSFVKAEYSFS